MNKKLYVAPSLEVTEIVEDVLMFSNYDNVGGDEEWGDLNV